MLWVSLTYLILYYLKTSEVDDDMYILASTWYAQNTLGEMSLMRPWSPEGILNVSVVLGNSSTTGDPGLFPKQTLSREGL